MDAIVLGRIITRLVLIFLSGFLTLLLSKILSKEEDTITDKINKYSRSNLKLTVHSRKLLRIIRVLLPIIIYSVFIAICVVGIVVIMRVSNITDKWANSATISLGTAILVLFFNMMNSINIGNVSTLVKKELLSKNKHYTLYLRAFKSDRDSSHFSEKHFVRLLAKIGNPKLFAVGLPNETDAPLGAIRVYISDATWQQEVEELIQKATKIYLRVGDTEPCRWELGKSLLHKGKLILIVDNISEYNAIRTDFPNLPQLQAVDDSFYLMRYLESENVWETQKFKLSPKGYIDVTDNEAEYERIIHESEQEKKKLESLQINPKAIRVGCFVICLIVVGFYCFHRYMRSVDKHCSSCYSMTLSYDIISMVQPVNEVFEADNDTDAYKYAKIRFSSILDSIRSQYNGNLTHDDSLDLHTPISFCVYNQKGNIIIPNTRTRHELIEEYSNLIRNDSIHGAKWRMSIDDVQQISYFSKWQRKDIMTNIRDTTETLSLLCGHDTLANHIFDEYLYFLNFSSGQQLSGTILLSPQDVGNHMDITQVYSDVKSHLRKEYGAYRNYWDCKIKNVTCDTITYRDYSGVVVKTEFTYGSCEPRFNNMAQAIIEQLN